MYIINIIWPILFQPGNWHDGQANENRRLILWEHICSVSGVLLTVRLEIEESKCSTLTQPIMCRKREIKSLHVSKENKDMPTYVTTLAARTHEFKLMYWQYSLKETCRRRRTYTCRLLEVRYTMRDTYLQPANRKKGSLRWVQLLHELRTKSVSLTI